MVLVLDRRRFVTNIFLLWRRGCPCFHQQWQLALIYCEPQHSQCLVSVHRTPVWGSQQIFAVAAILQHSEIWSDLLFCTNSWQACRKALLVGVALINECMGVSSVNRTNTIQMLWKGQSLIPLWEKDEVFCLTAVSRLFTIFTALRWCILFRCFLSFKAQSFFFHF